MLFCGGKFMDFDNGVMNYIFFHSSFSRSALKAMCMGVWSCVWLRFLPLCVWGQYEFVIVAFPVYSLLWAFCLTKIQRWTLIPAKVPNRIESSDQMHHCQISQSIFSHSIGMKMICHIFRYVFTGSAPIGYEWSDSMDWKRVLENIELMGSMLTPEANVRAKCDWGREKDEKFVCWNEAMMNPFKQNAFFGRFWIHTKWQIDEFKPCARIWCKILGLRLKIHPSKPPNPFLMFLFMFMFIIKRRTRRR